MDATQTPNFAFQWRVREIEIAFLLAVSSGRFLGQGVRTLLSPIPFILPGSLREKIGDLEAYFFLNLLGDFRDKDGIHNRRYFPDSLGLRVYHL
jgi:hypothetical protein